MGTINHKKRRDYITFKSVLLQQDSTMVYISNAAVDAVE